MNQKEIRLFAHICRVVGIVQFVALPTAILCPFVYAFAGGCQVKILAGAVMTLAVVSPLADVALLGVAVLMVKRYPRPACREPANYR